MNNIQVLDCTLRDGGRIIDCAFDDSVICEMTEKLINAGIDIVEVGFLRDKKSVDYKGNSTFFTEVSQMERFIPPCNGKMCVAFIDFHMYDFDDLEPCSGKSITGIRVGFTKKQWDTEREELKECFLKVKQQGYKLMVQGVNSLAYSDREMLDIVDMLNEIEPYSFGIVDTYGAMYLDDIVHYYSLVDHNLKPGICIDIHSHNNFQLSFAFAQEIIALSSENRGVILDATLNGMGKCAGNLNTELIVDYLNKKKHCYYDFEAILDIIDDYIYEIKQNHPWGYSIPAFMAGVYKSHPNNVIYLTEKYRMNAKDIGNIIFMIDEETRQRYDYDNIEHLYIEYNTGKTEDEASIQALKQNMENQEILVVVPGHSITEYREKIDKYIQEKNPVIISVNFYSGYEDSYIFWGNKKRFHLEDERNKSYRSIICSNVHEQTQDMCVVNYYSLINKGYKYFDNSTIMLLNLLRKIKVKKIVLAGFDGFDENVKENFVDRYFHNDRYVGIFQEINRELGEMLKQYVSAVKNECEISFLTPSMFGKTVNSIIYGT